MVNGSQNRSDDLLARYLSPGADNVKLVYLLYLASVAVGVTVLIGLVVAYINRPRVSGTWMETHYTYLIRTFWIGLLYSIISVVLMVVGIGVILAFVVAIWAIVRCVKGLMWVADGKPVPNPESWVV